MVELKGTEKQVKWAEDIRQELMENFKIFEEAAKTINENDITYSQVKGTRKAIKYILTQDDSRFYIENFGKLKKYMTDKLRNVEKSYDKVGYVYTLVYKFENKGE